MAGNSKAKVLEKVIPSDHPLANLIPSKEVFGKGNYISRYIGGVKDMDILARAHALRHNVLIYGPTGPGKTSCVYAYAAENNLPVVNVSCNGAADPAVFIGGWQPKPDQSLHYAMGDVLTAVKYGGIIYLDEINFLPPKIAAYLHSLLDKRRTISVPSAQGSDVETVMKAHENCFIVATFNPDYEGTKPLNQAFRNRFAFQMEFDYDFDIEKELLNSPALLDLAFKLRQRKDIGDITTPIATNMLMEIEEFVDDDGLGFDFALVSFLNHFPVDERQIVREVLLVYAANIWTDLMEGEIPEDSEFHSGLKQTQSKEDAEAEFAEQTVVL